MDERLAAVLDEVAAGSRRIVALTGAGISAESGVPTFRGPEGYWTVGSRVYHPQELATWAAFSRDPALVWPWYLYRRELCAAAAPNAAHDALARLERALGDRLLLVTQNVDGLHIRAGSSPERTYAIHGDLNLMRCSEECSDERVPLPALPAPRGRDTGLDEATRAALRCPRCGAWARPHVLWFDESYDEPRYRFESALRAVRDAGLLLVVGTSGGTTLPALMGRDAVALGVPVVDINPAANPFSQLAATAPRGFAVRDTATHALPLLVDRLIAGVGVTPG